MITDGEGTILYSRDLEREIALEGIALARSMGAASYLWVETVGVHEVLQQPDNTPC